MQVLEDLYMGDIHPSERSFKRDSQYARALNKTVKAGDARPRKSLCNRHHMTV